MKKRKDVVEEIFPTRGLDFWLNLPVYLNDEVYFVDVCGVLGKMEGVTFKHKAKELEGKP